MIALVLMVETILNRGGTGQPKGDLKLSTTDLVDSTIGSVNRTAKQQHACRRTPITATQRHDQGARHFPRRRRFS
jgi:adhesin HecA-like repeat protein